MTSTYQPTPARRVGLADWLPVLAVALVLVFAVALPGCGGAAAARPADPDLARKALHDVLDAWQRGAAHDASAVRVADEDWLSGAKLVSYKVADRDEPVGARLRCRVDLTLRDARGKTVARKAVYDVTTDPAPIVVRLD
jgi:hypothetical protein